MLKYLILLLIISCLEVNGQNIDKFKHYKIDIEAKRTDFFSLISDVEIIRLEETESSLLSYVRYYFNTPEGFGIINKNKVSFFDKEGNFLAVISNLGDGPNEYQAISAVWYRNGHFELFSSSSRSVGYYSLQGAHLKTIQAKYSKEWWGGKMIPIDDGYWLHLLDPSWNDKSKYVMVKLNFDLEPIQTINSKAIPHPFPVNLGKRFTMQEDHVFYKKVLNDSLFLIKNNQLKPSMRFDFGDDWTWSDKRNLSSIRAASIASSKSEKIIEVLPDIGKTYIALTHLSGLSTKKIGCALINRLNDKVIRLDLRKSNKENFEVFFIEWQEGQLIASLPVYDLEEFISNLSESQYKIVGGYDLEEIMASENPVLLKIKFK